MNQQNYIGFDLLHPPQVPHTQSIIESLRNNRVALDSSDTGVGKSIMASIAAKNLDVPVFVICPKAVIPAWDRWFKHFGITKYIVINYEKLVRGKSNKYLKWVLPKGTDTYIAKFRNNIPTETLFILDECHRCKALESLNSELHMSCKDGGFYILNLSASAATTPLEMKSIGYVLGTHNYRDPNHYKRHYCAPLGAEWTGRFGTMTWDPNSDKCRNSMEKLHHDLYNVRKVAFRLTREQMGTYFPETQLSSDALDMGVNGQQIQRVYDQMERELSMLEEHTKNYSEHFFAILMKARRHAELLKVPTIVQMIEDYVSEGMSVAVFVNFTETIDAIDKRLKKQKKFDNKISYIRGGQSTKVRQEEIDKFQSDESHVMLSNIFAAGVGISLHDVNGLRARSSIISPGFSAIAILQAFGRVWRQGGKSKSIQRVVFAAKTIEEKACDRLRARLGNLNLLNDGDLTAGINIPEGLMFNFEREVLAA